MGGVGVVGDFWSTRNFSQKPCGQDIFPLLNVLQDDPQLCNIYSF